MRVPGRRDRRGPLVLGLLALLWAAPAQAAPGSYKASRFDVSARVVEATLDVTESVTFQFLSGTFTHVWRDIPASRTDGIDIVGATMDGVALTPGDGPGHFTVSGRSRVRVEWHFAPIATSTHRFDLHYVARGVAYRDGAFDVVRWRALPNEHQYRIDTSRIQFEPSSAQVAPLETHRLGAASLRTSNETVTIEASDIQPNGWIIAELHYPGGSLTAADPAWRGHEAAARQIAPRWAMGSAAVFVVALALVLLVRQGYPSPPPIAGETTAAAPPQPLPAAIASVLAAKGRAYGYQPLGTILDLADRGVLVIRETWTFLASHGYQISQVAGKHDLEPHEEEALRIAFAGSGEDVSLSRLRGRLARGSRRFSAALNQDLLRRGLLDPARKAARDRLAVVGIVLLLAGLLGLIGASPLIPTYDAWPFLVPVGLVAAALVAIIMAASLPTVTDEGLVEGAAWRGFRRSLKALAAQDDDSVRAPLPSRWIVYAIAFGLGPYWVRYLKRHPDLVPPWFVSSSGGGGDAFAVFVGTSTAGGHGGAGGGAAGGGGSGAG